LLTGGGLWGKVVLNELLKFLFLVLEPPIMEIGNVVRLKGSEIPLLTVEETNAKITSCLYFRDELLMKVDIRSDCLEIVEI